MSDMIPRVYHELLPRLGIAQAIDSAAPAAAVYIVAPYGCGKTLAVISWLRALPVSDDRRVVWFDLTSSDNSPDAFHPMREEILREELAENILVLDNFHFIRDAKLLKELKDFILVIQGRWRVILLSRADLPPVFNDLILKGRISMLTLTELRFSEDEIADYFTLNGCAVSREAIARLHAETDGWPAALNVVLAVSRGGPVAYGEAAREYVARFFDTEVWSELDESTREFLLKTSILTKLTPAACNAVTEIGATLPTISWLFMNGLFVTRVQANHTYQYHRVFKEFLERKLIASSIDEKALYKKLAWWLYERNEFEQAFTMFFRSGDLYGIDCTLKVLNPGKINAIEEYLELVGCIVTLDIESLKPYPAIVAQIALLSFLKGELDEMQRLRQIYMEWIDPGVLPILPEEYAEFVWNAGWLVFLDPDEVVPNEKHNELTHYREYVPQLDELHMARAALFGFPSILRGMRNYTEVAPMIEAYWAQAAETGESAIGDDFSVLQLDLMMAEYYYEREDFTHADALIRKVMTAAETKGIVHLYQICTALRVKLLRARNQVAEIPVFEQRLETMIAAGGQHFLLQNFHAFQQRNRLAEGQIGFTEVFERDNRSYKYEPYFFLLYRQVTVVRALLSLGAYNEALTILGKLELLCQKYKRVMDLIELNILRTAALSGLGDEQAAGECLLAAMQSAKHYGYVRLFADDARLIWHVLEYLRKQNVDRHINRLIVACKKALKLAGAFPSEPHAKLTLTKTERRVFKSLQLGMSYGEIALENRIHLSTVKSHVHSIYSKLGVNNRTAAVLAAKEQGMIE